jgi:hypothetical protein
MENLKKIITAELENFEFDLLKAEGSNIEALRQEALSHVFGAERAYILVELEAEEWRERINAAADFRKFKLEYQKGEHHG